MSQQQVQQMQMAGMGGPVGGGPVGGQRNVGTPGSNNLDMSPERILKKLNTAIYDYLLRNQLYDIAKSFIKQMDVETKQDVKQSPNQRGSQQPNGIDDGLEDPKDAGLLKKPDDLPLPANMSDGPFLQDWWSQFWDIYHCYRGNAGGKQGTQTYIGAQRMAQKGRLGMMGGMDPNSLQNIRGYNTMAQGMNNPMGMNPNDLKRTAMQQNQQRNM